MPEYKDQIPGGLGDKKTPDEFSKSELDKGVKVELEHTPDKDLALEIAIDHLTEHPEYYKALEKMEKELEARMAKRAVRTMLAREKKDAK